MCQTYIQQTVHSYLHQFRHRDLVTASLQAAIRLFNVAHHLSANVTHRHSYLHHADCQPRHGDSNSSGGSAIACDAPWQLIISLVLVTTRLALLGSEIPSQQPISILKRKMLLVSPLRRLARRAIARGAFAISRYRDIVIPLQASAQWLAANLE